MQPSFVAEIVLKARFREGTLHIEYSETALASDKKLEKVSTSFVCSLFLKYFANSFILFNAWKGKIVTSFS